MTGPQQTRPRAGLFSRCRYHLALYLSGSAEVTHPRAKAQYLKFLPWDAFPTPPFPLLQLSSLANSRDHIHQAQIKPQAVGYTVL